MNRKNKHAFVESFQHLASDAPCLFVIRQFGMDASSTVFLRRGLHDVGASLRVVKNRLVKKALEGATFPENFSSAFTGPTAVVFAVEPVSTAKILVDFAKKNEGKVEVFVGLLEGQQLNEAGIKGLSVMPSLEQLRVQLLGLMLSPATRLARALKEAQSGPVRALNAHCQKN